MVYVHVVFWGLKTLPRGPRCGSFSGPQASADEVAAALTLLQQAKGVTEGFRAVLLKAKGGGGSQ